MTDDLTYSTQLPSEKKASELGIKIDKRSNVPIFVQLQNSIKYLVASGELSPGDRLPSVRKLAQELSINPNTVDKAYMNLESEGFISIEKGRGTFIKNVTTTIPEKERHRQLDILTKGYLNSALKLGFTREEIIQEIQSKINLE